jgi:acyl-CoA synthetase (AMP-forming)/AMP-acid ligase II
MTLQLTLQENAKAFPGRIWLRYEGVQWSCADGDIITRRIAAGLIELGIKPGDRVALLFTNCLELVFCCFACSASVLWRSPSIPAFRPPN